MPDFGFVSPASQRGRAVAALRELAAGSGSELMVAALVLAAARASAVAGEPGPGVVAELASRWDDRAVTAAEFAEQMPAAEFAALLAGAPAWAESFGPPWRAAA